MHSGGRRFDPDQFHQNIMRKTIKVDDLRNFVNLILNTTQDSATEFREGAIFVLEQFLIATDNHKGYVYVSNGKHCSESEQPDKTRRSYLKKKIK